MVVSSGATSLYVTHDVGEALALADDIVFLQGGRVLGQGTPQEIYHSSEPAIRAMISSSGL
jgi:ABC-type sugar transport system ATPase subunit